MKTLLYIFTFLFSMAAFAQTNATQKISQKDLKNAELYFETEDYLNAIMAYKKILAIEPYHEIANLNSAISRIKLGQSTDSCYLNLIKLKSSKRPEVQFYFGQIYHHTLNFEEAIKCFETYRAIPEKERTILNAEVDYNIACSKNAKEFSANPHRSIIKNIGNKINSAYADYVPLILPDESYLYFTSRRAGSTGNLKDFYGNYYEDVYISQHLPDGTWGEAKNIGLPINTNTHDACVALSFDGNNMIIYRTAPDLLTGDLYLSHTDYEGWTVPKKYGTEINTPYIETSACFSNDTSVIYFSSNKPGGFGGKDIYRIKKLPTGRWSNPMNLGPTINTDKDEDSPFIHPDRITLYFSSKGHNTMGEYDVFKSVLNTETNEFISAENLGFPINSVNNDIFFVLNTDGTKGYYSSIKENTFGGSDIYTIDMRYGDNDLKVKHCKVMIGKEVSKAKITVIDNETKLLSGIYNSNAITGKFILILNPYKSYKAIVEEEGYHTMIFELEPCTNDWEDNDLILSLTKKK